jgi:hypothetical protein
MSMSFRNTKENEEKNPNEKMNYNEITIEALIKHIKRNPSDKAAIDLLHKLQKANKQTKSHTTNKNPNGTMGYSEIEIKVLENPNNIKGIRANVSLSNQLQKANKQTKSHTPNKSINKKPKPLSIVIGVMIAMAIILVAVIGSQNVLKTGFSNPPDLNTYVPIILILIILLYICYK